MADGENQPIASLSCHLKCMRIYLNQWLSSLGGGELLRDGTLEGDYFDNGFGIVFI